MGLRHGTTGCWVRDRGAAVNAPSALDARDDMLAIADAWPDLLDRLGREQSRHGERVSGTRPVGLSINELVSDTMREVDGWVHFLARVLMDELLEPWVPRSTDTPDLLREIARERIGHFTHHADEALRIGFYDDAHRLRGLVTRRAYPTGKRVVPLHIPCTEHDTSDLGERVQCAGQFGIMLDPDRPGFIPDMVCSDDPTHRISPAEWQRASRRTAMDPTAAAALIARIRAAT